jgi:hypothetical protein
MSIKAGRKNARVIEHQQIIGAKDFREVAKVAVVQVTAGPL